mmetsp:Transcript_3153/g.4470  ORF Transcript_3153/g.4470 Transcript_3153/m.4470 type:complete len:226 (-) Transcript_3153:273-950(-)|eukprot:CAMPEP_0117752970 /NCGR_PEP_ID=MMETSP0947-20121206/11944_1 /TAXON_ID=44440 /ORGANISM="Chattonella subsalsa, Strain CCMP2191" /LENGTH=225 /DNA_ID=CAMNT_0005571757 /DNA_START=60 /DNA_END=737 /DNA_ORIENTATION=+
MSKVLRQELEAKLASLDGPEWDSASESEEEKQLNIIEIPDKDSHSTPQKKRKKKKAKKESAVIYLGHIPHGFYEKEMSNFFDQFGDVKQLRLSRCRRGGRSRGYAFIEFKSPEVAQIVAETMHGYFLEDKQLVCHVVPKEKVHPRIFQAGSRRLKVEDWQKLAREEHNKPKTAEQLKKSANRLIKKEDKKRKKLEALGIDYKFPGFRSEYVPPSKHIKFDESDDS